jgi:hypothetical protein
VETSSILSQIRLHRKALVLMRPMLCCQVVTLPAGDVALVRSLERDGRTMEFLAAGDNADVTLQGVEVARLSNGSVLCKGKAAVPVASRFTAQITTLGTMGTPLLKVRPVPCSACPSHLLPRLLLDECRMSTHLFGKRN